GDVATQTGLLAMAAHAGANVALGLPGVVARIAVVADGEIVHPPVGMELERAGIGTQRHAAGHVERHATALMAAQTERLIPMATAALGRIAPRVGGMNRHVVVGVYVHRFDDAIVAGEALVFAMTVETILLVVARHARVIAAEVGSVRI